jgi:hypothetical protein
VAITREDSPTPKDQPPRDDAASLLSDQRVEQNMKRRLSLPVETLGGAAAFDGFADAMLERLPVAPALSKSQ